MESRGSAARAQAWRWRRQRPGVIAHIVLFRPRADVTEAERQTFVAALERACRDVPTIRRASVGRSLPGDQGGEFPYTAVIEFDNETDLQAYIAHPLHQPLAKLFWQTCAAVTIVNAKTVDGREPLGGFLLRQPT